MPPTQTITTTIQVRFRDIDSMGHVNNAVYFTYFEEGRKAFIQELFGLQRPKDFSFILANVSCDFQRPVKLNDRITLHVWISTIRTKRFDMQYELVDAQDQSVIYALGQSVQVFYDYQQNRSIPIPEDIREKLSVYCRAE